MSATELIKQVASLPQRERTLFEQLFHAMKNGNRAANPASQANWPDFGQRLRGIYGDKIALDSQNIFDEGREVGSGAPPKNAVDSSDRVKQLASLREKYRTGKAGPTVDQILEEARADRP